MRVCVVGSGGREHALAHVLSRSAEVVVTPGNPGIPGSSDQPAEQIDADLFVIGPEGPLVDGMADRLRSRGHLVLGPGADGARLEGSKRWMKQLLSDGGVPTAGWACFDRLEPALAHLGGMDGPFVIKTDGLAAGKGVLVTTDRSEAIDDVRAKLSGESFGEAGRRVVIEEGMGGAELSVFAVCDGRGFVTLPAARDHKRVGDGDTGPNTGGMGAYTPVAEATPALMDEVHDRILEPTVAALRKEGIDYRGVLYAGLMLTADGPKVIEYNVRFGDPEAQVVLPQLDGDVAELLAAAAAGSLGDQAPAVSDDACLTVVLCSPGYPAAPEVGSPIVGLDAAAEVEGVTVFHAATTRAPDGSWATGGGRVLDVTARGSSLDQARQRAYRAASLVQWSGIHFRRDIALASEMCR